MIAQRFQDIKLVLLDMDGTIYLQDRLFDGVKELLAYFKRHGIRAVYLTNNSARSVQDYILKLRRMGIETTEEDFFTSAQATEIDLLKNHACDKIYVVGTESLKQQFRAAGLRIAEAPEEDVSVLVSAYDTELTYKSWRILHSVGAAAWIILRRIQIGFAPHGTGMRRTAVRSAQC